MKKKSIENLKQKVGDMNRYITSLSERIDSFVDNAGNQFNLGDLVVYDVDYLELLGNMRDSLCGNSDLGGRSLSKDMERVLHKLDASDTDANYVKYVMDDDKRHDIIQRDVSFLLDNINFLSKAENSFIEHASRSLFYIKALNTYSSDADVPDDEIAAMLKNESAKTEFLVHSSAVLYIGYLTVFLKLRRIIKDLPDLGLFGVGHDFLQRADIESIAKASEDVICTISPDAEDVCTVEEMHSNVLEALLYVKNYVSSQVYDFITNPCYSNVGFPPPSIFSDDDVADFNCRVAYVAKEYSMAGHGFITIASDKLFSLYSD